MNKGYILIVDDQNEVRAEVRERMESVGYEADEAACQEEALEKIKGLHFDCVLLDLKIPVKLEGVPVINHGKNTLERIVAGPDAPPVIVITSQGLNGHKTAVEIMELGAKSFVGKPFDDDQLEQTVKRVLKQNKGTKSANPTSELQQFEGGAFIVHDDHFELCGVDVGGARSDSIIRNVIQRLLLKKDGKFRKASAKALSESINNSYTAQSITSAIADFRNQCIEKLRAVGIECRNGDVIKTEKGGGYLFREWIEIRMAPGNDLSQAVEEDCSAVLRAFGRQRKQALRAVIESVSLPPMNVKAAMQLLERRGQIKNAGGSGLTTTYELLKKTP